MENRRGNGIFLGVVSIATLVVAIIGATFAYFSAQVTSNDNAVSLTAYDAGKLSVTGVTLVDPEDATSGIIPLNITKTTTGDVLLHAMNVAATPCIDERGYQVCAIYKATINNEMTQAATLSVEIGTVVNTAKTGDENKTPFEDLKVQSLTYNTNTYAFDGAAVTIPGTAGTSQALTGVTITAAAETQTDHYFVVWLDEATAEDDQSAQMGAHFEGKIVYSTGDNGSKLTGTFNLGE